RVRGARRPAPPRGRPRGSRRGRRSRLRGDGRAAPALRARATGGLARRRDRRRRRARRGPAPTIEDVDRKEVGDRQLDALLERLDRLTAEVRQLNRRLDSGDNLAPIVYELRQLNESLNALAYAALGQAGPQVRRRRAS